MVLYNWLGIVITGAVFAMGSPGSAEIRNTILSDTLHYPEETHFRNLRQLTFGGDNAEAYFSYDGKYLVYQKPASKKGYPVIRYIWAKFLKALQSLLFRN